MCRPVNNNMNENTPLMKERYRREIGDKQPLSTEKKVGLAVCIIFLMAAIAGTICMTVLAGKLSHPLIPVLSIIPMLILGGACIYGIRKICKAPSSRDYE